MTAPIRAFVSTPLAALLREGTDAPGTSGTPYRIAPGDSFVGSVGFAYDTDVIKIQLVAGKTYTFNMTGGTLSDTFLELYGPDENSVASNDDFVSGQYDVSQFTFTATRTGVYYIEASAYDDETGSYTVAVTESGGGTTPGNGMLTMTEVARYLTDGYWEDKGGSRRAFDVGQGGTLTCDISDLSAAEQQVAKMALLAWSEVTGIRFDTTSRAGASANIQFVNDNASGAYAQHTGGFGTTITTSMVNIPISWAEGPNAGFASYFYQTYIHEIGHALGLGHAGNYNGSADWGVDNNYANDSWQATVMSYFNQTDNPNIDASYAYVATPMMADIIAMHSLYGLSTGLFGANTVWGFGSNITGAFATANRMMVAGRDITMTIFDQGGQDLLNLWADGQAQRINLNPGTISDCFGLVGNLSIAGGTIIENVSCGSGADLVWGNGAANWLRGNAGNDRLFGGPGNDSLNGGAGADTLTGGMGNDVYTFTTGDVLIEVAGGGVDLVRASNNNTLAANIEQLVLVDAAAHGTGNALNNRIEGNALANRLWGAAGNDTLVGGAGNDTMAGGAGVDRLVGGAGDDLYQVDASDILVELAGGGYDTVQSGVTIRMGAEFEAAILNGTGATSIVGNAKWNALTGNAGANLIDGGGGRDVMTGGYGADIFHFRVGNGGRITDFQNDIDTIRIVAQNGAMTIGQALADAVQGNGGVTLSYGGTNLFVAGTTIADLRDDLIIG